MKTITIDFDTYQAELKAVKTLGSEQVIENFKDFLIRNLQINNMTMEDCLKQNIPPDRLMDIKAPAQRWLSDNFNDEALLILLNRR